MLIKRTFIAKILLCAAWPAFSNGIILTANAQNVGQNADQKNMATQTGQNSDTFFVGEIVVLGNTVLDSKTIERAVYPHVGPNRTVDDVNAAVKDLQDAYKNRGLESVYVQSPIQTYSDNTQRLQVVRGVVTIRVTEAPVGRLKIAGTKYSSPAFIRSQAPSVAQGKVPDLRSLQTELTEINRNPDRQVTPVIAQGKAPATIDITLKVKDHLPFHIDTDVNNDHSTAQSMLKASVTAKYTNLFQLGHTISASYAVTPQNRQESEVISGTYLAPIWGTLWSLLAYGYVSNSNVKIFIPGLNVTATANGTNIEGDRSLGNGFTVGARALYKLASSPTTTQSLSFGVDYKLSEQNISVPGIVFPKVAPIFYWPLNASYTLATSSERSALNLTVAVTFGIRNNAGDSRPPSGGVIVGDLFREQRFNAKGNFVHLNLDADYTRDLKYDFVSAIKIGAQFSDTPQIPTEQFNLGGNTTVRGYFQAEGLGDDGMYGSLELRSPSIARYFGRHIDEWRFFGFLDGGYAHVREALPGQQADFGLMSSGFGTRIKLFNHVNGDVSLAIPLRSTPDSPKGTKRVVFGVKTNF